MTQYLPIVLAAGLVAFLSTPLTRWLAHRWGMLAQPGPRKVHHSPVPLLGGLAMYLALVAAFLFVGQRDWLVESAGILGGATLIFVTGLWDDRFGMPAWIKFAAQGIATLCLIAVGIQVHLLNLGWADVLITLMWVLGITNALNLMDNMDGLAAGLTAIAAAFFFVMAALEGQGLVASLAAALLGAALGFLFYNTAPAFSFMGDAGALMLGFLLAVLGIKLKFISHQLGSTWMAPIVVLGVLIFDTTLVTLSRWRRGRPILQGGSDHTSHRLTQLGLSRPRAVLTLYVVAAALGGAAMYLTGQPVFTANVAFGVLMGIGLVTLIIFERIEPQLMGNPPLALIPGGDGAATLPDILTISRVVTLLLAPRHFGAEVRPTQAEILDAVAALAEDTEAVRAVLQHSHAEWWRTIHAFNQALRITGAVFALADSAETPPAALEAVRQARLILLGPGDPAINLLPALAAPGMRAALEQTRGQCVWIGDGPPPEVLTRQLSAPLLTVSPATLQTDLHKLLLAQAAGEAKTRR